MLASDLSHFYQRMEQVRAFPELYKLGDRLAGSNTLRRLATSAQHIIPGHRAANHNNCQRRWFH